jgi:hypothetical protein
MSHRDAAVDVARREIAVQHIHIMQMRERLQQVDDDAPGDRERQAVRPEQRLERATIDELHHDAWPFPGSSR